MPNGTVTKTLIANMALAHIKQRSIASPDEASEPARKVNLFYDPCRRAVLRSCDWNFATTTSKLALLGDQQTAMDNPTDQSKQDVILGWNYLYSYPAKCIRARNIISPVAVNMYDPYMDRTLYDRLRAEGNLISDFRVLRSPITNVLAIPCQLQNAYCEFTIDITDEGQFDDMFVEGFSYYLAAKLAIPLTGDKELKQIMEEEYDRHLGEAKRKNGGEGTERQPRPSEYEKARDY
jgi:hypothetical protein